MRSSHARRIPLFGIPLVASLLTQTACDQTVPGDHQLTSLRMSLMNPTESELGTPNKTVSPQSLHFSTDALDESGQPFASSAMVNTFLVAGGTRLPLVDPCSAQAGTGDDPDWLLSRFALDNGHAPAVILPLTAAAIFGRLTLNIEEPVSQAAGATPPIFFPNPTIMQIVKPRDITAANASFCSTYLGRQVQFDNTSPTTGKLVVSSVFQNALAVSDTSVKEFGSLYVFTFSQPDSQLVKGRVLSRLAGAVAKFNGMTQVANPTVTASSEIHADIVPAPIELDASRRPAQTANAAANQWLIQYIAAPVRITGIVCETSQDNSRKSNWMQYNTVAINQTGDNDPTSVNGCGGVNSTAYVPPTRFGVQFSGKGVGGFDPAVQAGKEVTITGMLQNSVSKSGKTLYWTVVVRDESDVCLLPRAQCKNI